MMEDKYPTGRVPGERILLSQDKVDFTRMMKEPLLLLYYIVA